MKAVTFFGGAYSGANKLAEQTASVLGCKFIQDDDLIEKVAQEYELSISDLKKSIYAKPSIPIWYSFKSERCIAALKVALADEMKRGTVVISGFLGELVPSDVALHVLVMAGSDYRLQRIFRKDGFAGKQLAKVISKLDQQFYQWSDYLKKMGSWNLVNNRLVVRSDHMEFSSVIKKITSVVEKRSANEKSGEKALNDFALAAKVSGVMADNKIPVSVSVRDACVKLTIIKPVLMLNRYKKKLVGIALDIPGVRDVRTRLGLYFHRSDIVSKFEFTLSTEWSLKAVEREYSEIKSKIAGYRSPMINL